MKETPPRERLVVALSKMTDVRLRRGTRLIDITVVHQVPELTRLIANSIVEEYKGQSVEQHTSTSEVANEFLMQEANRLKEKLQKSENDLQAYRERTAIGLKVVLGFLQLFFQPICLLHQEFVGDLGSGGMLFDTLPLVFLDNRVGNEPGQFGN